MTAALARHKAADDKTRGKKKEAADLAEQAREDAKEASEKATQKLAVVDARVDAEWKRMNLEWIGKAKKTFSEVVYSNERYHQLTHASLTQVSEALAPATEKHGDI